MIQSPLHHPSDKRLLRHAVHPAVVAKADLVGTQGGEPLRGKGWDDVSDFFHAGKKGLPVVRVVALEFECGVAAGEGGDEVGAAGVGGCEVCHL